MRSRSSQIIKRILASMITVLLFAAAVVPAFAAQDGASESGDRTVRMGFFEFGGMFNGTEEGARKSGYCYEYMMHVATYTGWKYEFVYGSYGELYEQLKSGRIDILPYTNFNDQRAREVLFGDKALAEEEYYIAVRADGNVNPPDSLDGAVISTLEGADYNRLLLGYLNEHGIDASIRYYPHLDETWDAVLNGEADATVFTSNAYSEEGWDCICTFGRKPTYIAVAKTRPELLPRLNEATGIIDVDNPELLGELTSKYFSGNPMRRSLSAEEQLWLDGHPVLHVGVFRNDAPYISFIDNETGEARGLTVDVVNGILERLGLGVPADFKGFDSLDEMENALEAGEIDIIMPFYPDYDVAQQHNLVISNIVRMANMELVFPFKEGITYFDALRKIATPATGLGINYLRNCFPQCEIIETATAQAAVDMVLRGEATGAIGQNVVLHNIKEKYDRLDYAVLPEGCGTCFAALRENYPVIRILNRGLNYFSTAEISAVASQYGLEPNVTLSAFLASHREATALLIVILIILTILAVSLVQVNHLKIKADEASRSKTSFLFNMSHDIRTPLNAITGFTKMAKKSVRDEEKVTDYLDKIDISGQQLLGLVNQILEMARIESGRIELVENPVDICREYGYTVAVLSEQAEEKGLAFHPSLEGVEHGHVLADAARVSSITLNIAGNAMKYTPRGGSVDFRLKEIPARKEGFATYVLAVEDTGIGMSEEYQKILFEPFTREKNSTVSRIQGAGLGMSIVKSIVDLMGGDIEVQSEPGKGSKFTVTIDFKIDGSFIPEAGTNNAAAPATLEGRRVLLVEDNELNREIAKDILDEEGLSVEEADDGTVAVELLRAKGPDYYDFILMDIQMPVMNGYDATREIRKMYPDRHVPVIALSANAFAEDRAASLAAGMDDHVAKPINIAVLLETLEKYI